MRKIISVILAVLMLFSAMAVSASAAEGKCNCDDHTDDNLCHCCPYCTSGNMMGFVTPCHKVKNEEGRWVIAEGEGAYCCEKCDGFIGNDGTCGCKCSCCTLNADGTIGEKNMPFGGLWDELWDEEAQQEYVSGFQAILSRISEVFDKIFDAIFEFLRLDEVLGRN